MVKMNFSEKDVLEFVKMDIHKELKKRIDNLDSQIVKMISNKFLSVIYRNKLKNLISEQETYINQLDDLLKINSSDTLYTFCNKMCSSHYKDLLLINLSDDVETEIIKKAFCFNGHYDGKHFATFVAMRDGGINPDKDGIYLEDGKILLYHNS